MTAIETDKQIISTYHEEILGTQPRDVLGLAPCTQEEADSGIMLHLKDNYYHRRKFQGVNSYCGY